MSDEANNPSPELALETDPAPEAVEVEDTQPVENVSDNEAEAVEVEADAALVAVGEAVEGGDVPPAPVARLDVPQAERVHIRR